MTERSAYQVDVVMGGPGREAVVSRDSGQAIVEALRGAGCDVVGIDCSNELDLAQLRQGSIVFNIIHGTYGEDGRLQQQLEAAGWAYVGSDATASALCMDKGRTRTVLEQAGIAVPWGVTFDPKSLTDHRRLKPPYQVGFVLKPQRDGSSVGLRMLPSTSFLLPTLEELVTEIGAVPMLLEERLPGPEYTVAVLDAGNGDGHVLALPPIHIEPSAEVYDYHAKYRSDDTNYSVVDGERAELLMRLAAQAFTACGCRDVARIDFMYDRSGEPRALEVNTLPGFTSHSLLPKAAAAVGISFTDICLRLVSCAVARQAPAQGNQP